VISKWSSPTPPQSAFEAAPTAHPGKSPRLVDRAVIRLRIKVLDVVGEIGGRWLKSLLAIRLGVLGAATVVAGPAGEPLQPAR